MDGTYLGYRLRQTPRNAIAKSALFVFLRVRQFAECNNQLKERVANNSEFRSLFNEDQLADIEDGYTPEGYTWLHNEEVGKMQLVNSDIHSATRHTGGRYIWGGGT